MSYFHHIAGFQKRQSWYRIYSKTWGRVGNGKNLLMSPSMGLKIILPCWLELLQNNFGTKYF